jgi:hypothetical protein
MRTPRVRHYVPAPVLTVTRPLFRYSATRDAFVLRIAHGRSGPVLKRERRRNQDPYKGPERRADRLSQAVTGGPQTTGESHATISGSR